MNHGIILHNIHLRINRFLISFFTNTLSFYLFDLLYQLPPLTLIFWMLSQNFTLKMESQKEGKVSTKLIEGSNIECYFLNIVALIFDIDLLDPTLGFHRSLQDIEYCADIGYILDQGYYLFYLVAVAIEKFIDYSQNVRLIFANDDVLKILKFDAFVIYFMKIFRGNIVFLHFRGYILKIYSHFHVFFISQLQLS